MTAPAIAGSRLMRNETLSDPSIVLLLCSFIVGFLRLQCARIKLPNPERELPITANLEKGNERKGNKPLSGPRVARPVLLHANLARSNSPHARERFCLNSKQKGWIPYLPAACRSYFLSFVATNSNEPEFKWLRRKQKKSIFKASCRCSPPQRITRPKEHFPH